MDAQLVALAVGAANTAVTLLVTDGWRAVADGLGGLWRRVRPDRAEAVQAELVQARDELLAAQAAGADQARQVQEAMVEEWRARLARLLATHPALAGELRRLVEGQWTPALPAGTQAWAGDVCMDGTAAGEGRGVPVGQG